MRILVISNLYPPNVRGGYEVSCAQMVGALRDVGHQVLVVTSRIEEAGEAAAEPDVWRTLELPPIYDAGWMAAMTPEDRRRAHMKSNYVNLGNAEELIRAIDRFEPDVAYLWNTLGLGGLGVLALMTHYGLPWVWHVCDLIPVQITRFGAGGDALSRELDKVFPGRFLFVSSRLLGEVRVEGAQIRDRVAVVRNAVDLYPLPPRTDFFADGPLRLVHAVGTLSEPKGTGIAIEAVARARLRTGCELVLDIYGRETDTMYRRQIEELGLVGVARLLGSQPHHELVQLYRSYDVILVPTWAREPFGRTALDAAANGCVPLFTQDMGLAEWLIDGVDCLKAYRSADAFADRLGDIVTGRIDLAALGRRAQSIVRRDFTLVAKRAAVEAAVADAAAEQRPARGDGPAFMRLARFADALAETLLTEAGVK